MRDNLVKNVFSKNKKIKRLLTIYAHPDDEVINAGVTLYQARKEGIETFILCLSRGEKGVFADQYINSVVKTRQEELKKVCKYLDATALFHESIPDLGFINNKLKLKSTINKVIKKIGPDVIITHDPSGISNHPDHIVTSEVVFDFVKQIYSSSIDLYFSTLTMQEKKFRKKINPNLDFSNLSIITHQVDIQGKESVKSDLYKIYESQNIAKRFSIPLDLWFSLQHFESFHKVNFANVYEFDLYEFNVLSNSFSPEKKKRCATIEL